MNIRIFHIYINISTHCVIYDIRIIEQSVWSGDVLKLIKNSNVIVRKNFRFPSFINYPTLKNLLKLYPREERIFTKENGRRLIHSIPLPKKIPKKQKRRIRRKRFNNPIPYRSKREEIAWQISGFQIPYFSRENKLDFD